METKQQNKIVAHLLPDNKQNDYSYDYWEWTLDDDGLYGYDGENGIVIMANDYNKIYKNYTEFSDNEILDSDFETIEETLTNLAGKEYLKYTQCGDFVCYYPKGEFSTDWLTTIGDIALGNITIYEIQDNDDYEYDTIIGNTIIVYHSLLEDDTTQIAKTLGVSKDDIVIKKPKIKYVYEEE